MEKLNNVHSLLADYYATLREIEFASQLLCHKKSDIGENLYLQGLQGKVNKICQEMGEDERRDNA